MGRLIIITGNGKGKSTSAFGTACRALGHGHRVCIIQFLKNRTNTGEHLFFSNKFDNLEFYTLGEGFVLTSPTEKDIAKAHEAWKVAEEKISSGRYQLLVLDEFTYALKYGLLKEERIIPVLKNAPTNLNIIITGRDAAPLLIEAADTVSEVISVKHAYQQGIPAEKGIEY